MKIQTFTATLLVASFAFAGSAHAAPYIVNTDLSNITSQFDSLIATTGVTAQTVQVTAGANSYHFTDHEGNAAVVTISRPDGSAPSQYPDYTRDGQSLSGAVWGVGPLAQANDPVPGFFSGLTFSFSSPVNAFGLEVGDWATCCFDKARPQNIVDSYGTPAEGSGLWVAFDGGTTTLAANALAKTDNPGFLSVGGFTNFIGAIDDSGFFSSITFFGDGFGEELFAGGTLRFAAVPLGSLSNTVPEPASLALLGIGLLGLAAARRRA